MTRTFTTLAALTGALLGHCLSSTIALAYTNPITVPNEYPVDGVGDPFVLKHNGIFYLYSSRVEAPGFQYWTSTDFSACRTRASKGCRDLLPCCR